MTLYAQIHDNPLTKHEFSFFFLNNQTSYASLKLTRNYSGGLSMKRFICLLFSITILFCGCDSSSTSNTTPSDFNPIDLSYEHVVQLTDFKCLFSYQDTNTTIEGDQAKELYKLVSKAMREPEHTPTSPDSDYVHMVFYNGVEASLPSNITQYYGTYTIYEDGWLAFALSPYHSASFDYKLETDLFDTVIEMISNS